MFLHNGDPFGNRPRRPMLWNPPRPQPIHYGTRLRPSMPYGHGYNRSMVSISAGKFKDTCLRILDEVAARRTPVTITKWGRPVARLLPVISPRRGAATTASAAGVEEAVQSYGSKGAGDIAEDAQQRLHRLAAELGVSPEDLLRDALDAYAGDPALDDLIERARRPVGAFRSGRTDIAEKHDEAFAEILEEEMARWRLPE